MDNFFTFLPLPEVLTTNDNINSTFLKNCCLTILAVLTVLKEISMLLELGRDFIKLHACMRLQNFSHFKNETASAIKKILLNHLIISELIYTFLTQNSDETQHQQGRCYLCERKKDRMSRVRSCKCAKFACNNHSKITTKKKCNTYTSTESD